MFWTIRASFADAAGRVRRAAILTAPVVALALIGPAARAASDYPPGLFENSPVVPHGYQPPADAPPPPPAAQGDAAPAAPPGADAELQPPDAGASPEPNRGLPPPPAPIAPAPPRGAYAGPPGGYEEPSGEYAGPRGAYAGPPGGYEGPNRDYGPPPSDEDYCAGIATRAFRSLGEVRRAHARCDRAYAAPPPAYDPPLY